MVTVKYPAKIQLYGKTYRRIGGMYWKEGTPRRLIQVLLACHRVDMKVRLYYGDSRTGRDWMERPNIQGTIGKTLSPGSNFHLPLLAEEGRVFNSFLLSDCVLKVKVVNTGVVLYQHSLYHTEPMKVIKINPEHNARIWSYYHSLGYRYAVMVNGIHHENFRTKEEAETHILQMTN